MVCFLHATSKIKRLKRRHELQNLLHKLMSCHGVNIPLLTSCSVQCVCSCGQEQTSQNTGCSNKIVVEGHRPDLADVQTIDGGLAKTSTKTTRNWHSWLNSIWCTLGQTPTRKVANALCGMSVAIEEHPTGWKFYLAQPEQQTWCKTKKHQMTMEKRLMVMTTSKAVTEPRTDVKTMNHVSADKKHICSDLFCGRPKTTFPFLLIAFPHGPKGKWKHQFSLFFIHFTVLFLHFGFWIVNKLKWEPFFNNRMLSAAESTWSVTLKMQFSFS